MVGGLFDAFVWVVDPRDLENELAVKFESSAWNVDALICHDDSLASEVKRIVSRPSFRPRRMVKVAGFDGLGTEGEDSRGMVSVRQPFKLIVETALKLLLRRISDSSSPSMKVMFPGTVIGPRR